MSLKIRRLNPSPLLWGVVILSVFISLLPAGSAAVLSDQPTTHTKKPEMQGLVVEGLRGPWKPSAVVIDHDGVAHIVTEARGREGAGIYYIEVAGKRVLKLERISHEASLVHSPDIALADGGLHAVWQRGQGRKAQIHYRRRVEGGWTPTNQVSRSHSGATSPQFVIGDQGTLEIEWTEGIDNGVRRVSRCVWSGDACCEIRSEARPIQPLAGHARSQVSSARTIAFLLDGDVWSVQEDGSSLTRLTHSGYVTSFAWSPNGQDVAYIAHDANMEGDVYVMRADGSGTRRLTQNSHASRWVLDWHGSKIVFIHGTDPDLFDVRIAYVDMNTPGGIIDLSPDIENHGMGFAVWCWPQIRWSPNGQWVALGHGTANGVVSVDGATFYDIDLNEPTWKHDSSHVIHTWYEFEAISFFDPNTASQGVLSRNDAHSAAYSPDDVYVAYATDYGLRRMNADDTGHVTMDYGLFDDPDWSPDGSGIVYASWCYEEYGFAYTGIHTIATDGSLVQLVAGWAHHPRWQPSESQVPAYSISGGIRDTKGDPIADVTISTDAGASATTDTSGAYTLTGLVTGNYTLTPSRPGWNFDPPLRTVTVPPDATSQDFVGTLTATAESSVTGGLQFFRSEAGEEPIPPPVFARGGGSPRFATQMSIPGAVDGVAVEVASPSGEVVKTVELAQSGGTWRGSWDWTSGTWATIPNDIPVGEYTARFRIGVSGSTLIVQERAFYVIFDPEEVTAPDRFAFNETGIWFGSTGTRGFLFLPGWGADQAFTYALHPDDNRVFGLAIAQIEGETNQYNAAQKLLSFENGMFAYDLNWHASDVIHLIEEETAAQCVDDANMLTALLRSVGIPSHPVTADAALEHGGIHWSFDTWLEARLNGPLGEQWYSLHPHEHTGLGPEPRDVAGNWAVATKSANDVIIMAAEDWDQMEVADSEDDLKFGYNECDEPNEDFDQKAVWIDHVCSSYWGTGHWTCPLAGTGLSGETPIVAISLDEERYAVGDTALITVSVSNPTNEPLRSTLGVSITADNPLSMGFPDGILHTSQESISLQAGESEVVTKFYHLPPSLSSDDKYYVEAEYAGSRAATSLALEPRFEWTITLPELVEVGDEFTAMLMVTNSLGIALESITGTLALRLDLETQDPLEQGLPALEPSASEVFTWDLTALSPSEVSQLVFAVLSEDAGSVSIFKGVEIAPAKTYLPLVVRSQ